MMIKYQDRLRGHDTVDSLWDEMEEVIAELGNEHFEQTYDGEICEACLGEIPLDAKRGPLSEMGDEVEELAEFVQKRFNEMDDYDGDIRPEVRGQYFDYYYERAVAPEDCAVCTAEVVDEDVPCGHWEEYRECPVRGEVP